MRLLSTLFRKIVILLIGVPLLVFGIILIPLPGPGLLVVLAALFILSLEFESARMYRDKLKTQFDRLLTKAREPYKKPDDDEVL